MWHRLTIALPDITFSRLELLAQRERREPKWQAVVLLEDAIAELVAAEIADHGPVEPGSLANPELAAEAASAEATT